MPDIFAFQVARLHEKLNFFRRRKQQHAITVQLSAKPAHPATSSCRHGNSQSRIAIAASINPSN